MNRPENDTVARVVPFEKPASSAWKMRRRFLRRLLWTRKTGGIGMLIVLSLVVLALGAGALAPYDPADQDLTLRYNPPSETHLLGTDNFGRDLLSRIIWGARISLQVGVAAVGISMIIGGALGLTAGYVGGLVDHVICSVIETLMAFPFLLLALTIITVLGPGLFNIMFAIGLASVPMFARVIRAELLSAREKDYVLAATCVGASHRRIVFKHIIPNILSSMIVLATTRVATAVLTESSLSFLGLGIRPPTPSWGVMVAEGRAFLERAPWIALIPGVIVLITVLGFSLLGDSLRDALDVRMR